MDTMLTLHVVFGIVTLVAMLPTIATAAAIAFNNDLMNTDEADKYATAFAYCLCVMCFAGIVSIIAGSFAY